VSGKPSAIRRAALAAALALFAGAGTPAHSQEPASERLSVAGPIAFGAETYRLSWSSHPSPDYYKQEYLPAGETSEHFRRMLLIEAIVAQADVERVAADQIRRLEQRKSADPVVNYAVARNPKTGEVIVDFVLSSDKPNADYIVEWDAYRYAPLRSPGGKSGVMLFGISRRAYGDEAAEFLRALKAMRPQEIDALARYKLPPVAPHD